jgi:hypothetical protein
MVNTRSVSRQATGAAGNPVPAGMEVDPPQDPGSAALDNNADDQLEETVKQRYKRIVAQVKLKRMEEDIKA